MAYVPMKKIAERAGVSVMSVSVALRNQKGVSAALALKIKAIAEEMGYRPPAVLQEAMGQLRMRHPARFHSTLALCTNMPAQHLNSVHRMQWQAMKERAKEFGYSLETFFLPEWSPRKLQSALRARNIRGVLLATEMRLSPELDFLLGEFACVHFGPARQLGLPIHSVEADAFQAGKKSAKEVLARGYRSLGLLRYPQLDPEGLYLAGIKSMIHAPASLANLPAGFPGTTNEPKKEFFDWVKAEKIECIMTMLREPREWLVEEGWRIPEDIGLIDLKKGIPEGENWSGIDPLWKDLSAAGVDKLVSMLRQGATGIPRVQESILIEGIWTEGGSLRPKRDQLSYGPEPPALVSAREDGTTLKCLDLQPYVNHSLSRPGGWFGGKALYHCVPGEHMICGTRFRILDEGESDHAALIMRSRRCPGGHRPNPVQVDIPIGQRVKAVHFLHGCGWPDEKIRNFANYQFIDREGRRRTLPLVDRGIPAQSHSDGNIQDWWPNLPALTTAQVRPVNVTEFGNAELFSAYLYILEWVNPNPRKVIQTLRITSNPEVETTLGVLAITLVV